MIVIPHDDICVRRGDKCCIVRGYPLPVCIEFKSIRSERQDIIGAVDHVSGNAAKFWIGQRLDDDLRSDSGGITHAQSHDGAVVGLGCVAHLHIVSATWHQGTCAGPAYDAVMPDPADHIARCAARLLHEGDVASLAQAIERAMQQDASSCESAPAAGLVRRHLRALRQQTLGADGYAQFIRDRYLLIEECMAALEWSIDDLHIRVAGKAAAGRFDEAVPMRFRVHTQLEDSELCTLLEELGFEVDRVHAVQTRHGRMTEVAATSSDVDVVLLRCQHRSQVTEASNLFTGGAVDLLDLAGVRQQLQGMSVSDDEPSSGM